MMRSLYPLIIVLAGACACGRLLSTQRVYEPSMRWPTVQPRVLPTFSSNDRSRWATVRALVDDKTWVIGKRDRRVIAAAAAAPLGALSPLEAAVLVHTGWVARTSKGVADTGIIFEDGYESVDKVLHPEKLEYYSSKPPLLTTIIAGLYWLIQALFGWTLSGPVEGRSPAAVVRTILVIVNIIPFMIYLWLLSRLVERWTRSDWARLLIVSAAGFATLVSPFLITLNNHVLGTFAVLGAVYALVRIDDARAVSRPAGVGWWVAAGFLCGFAVCMELPALAFAACVGGLLFLWSPLRTLVFFVPAAALWGAAFLFTNWLAVEQLAPAYSEFHSPWYQYEGSHWKRMPDQVKTGIDWARFHETRGEYALHVLIGHHGWFSLTPLWLLALYGMIAGCRPRRRVEAGVAPSVKATLPRYVPALTVLVSAVVIGFYLLDDRSGNYGGFTNGLRWLMWLTPLWLLCLIPVADRLATAPWGRRFTYACLAVSALTANYTPWNPWRHPWLYDLMVATGWWRGY